MTMKPKSVIPEVVEPDETLPPDLRRLKRFAVLLDAAVEIPGTRRRIGLDAAVGLIPGVGDAVGAVVSSWIIVAALRHRVPPPKILRMFANILLDLGIGTIPVIGDIFDLFFTENIGNVDIVIRNRNRTRPPRSVGRLILFSTAWLLLLFGLAIAMIVAIFATLFALLGRPLV